MIKIDFDNTFNFEDLAEDLPFITFNSILKNGDEVLLKVKISELEDPLLPNVYNLSFGPLDKHGKIDDTTKLNHADINRMFSTVLFFALIYLEQFSEVTIGVDGSNDARAHCLRIYFYKYSNYK